MFVGSLPGSIIPQRDQRPTRAAAPVATQPSPAGSGLGRDAFARPARPAPARSSQGEPYAHLVSSAATGPAGTPATTLARAVAARGARAQAGRRHTGESTAPAPDPIMEADERDRMVTARDGSGERRTPPAKGAPKAEQDAFEAWSEEKVGKPVRAKQYADAGVTEDEVKADLAKATTPGDQLFKEALAGHQVVAMGSAHDGALDAGKDVIQRNMDAMAAQQPPAVLGVEATPAQVDAFKASRKAEDLPEHMRHQADLLASAFDHQPPVEVRGLDTKGIKTGEEAKETDASTQLRHEAMDRSIRAIVGEGKKVVALIGQGHVTDNFQRDGLPSMLKDGQPPISTFTGVSAPASAEIRHMTDDLARLKGQGLRMADAPHLGLLPAEIGAAPSGRFDAMFF